MRYSTLLVGSFRFEILQLNIYNYKFVVVLSLAQHVNVGYSPRGLQPLGQ